MSLQSSTRSFLSPKAIEDVSGQNDSVSMTPDALFTKCTVVEVKAFQTRLRAEADAKQEELRLMVGERYRDLLQASAAIISISKSSKRVLEAIKESKAAILSQDNPPLPPKPTAVAGISDKHLTSLQVLSTHIKLLLDTPEHLWRLIERKKYLQAAWLFLLSRVAYRALITHEDERTWAEEGLEVETDFPLVQRQWEIVAQFRSQIIYKSTLSLRDISMSTEDICTALVTLHLLDSRPLNETLNTFLLQRSKKLQAGPSWKPHVKSSGKEDVLPLGTNYFEASGAVPIREVTQVMKDALNTIVQTVCTSRAIFHAQPNAPSLLLQVLESIQSEGHDGQLPNNLQISTPMMLGLLASSAALQLLPSDVKSYRPYVDLGTCSASLTQPTFFQKVEEWFRGSCERWKIPSSKWLSGINSVKEVWTLRTSIKRLITTSDLREEEKGYLSSNMDALCHDQIADIWKKKLSYAGDEFKRRLRSQVSEDAGSNQKLSMSDFLFTPTPIPPISQSRSSTDTAFQKYHLSLKRQLLGRSPQLDSVLSTLEACALTIQHDFFIIKGFEEENISPFVERLEQTYQPAANGLSRKVADIIEELITDLIKSPDSDSNGLVFLSGAVDSLVSSSSFIDRIGCGNEAVKGFKERTTSISNKALEEWRNATVKRIVDEAKHQLNNETFRANGPSPVLLHSLLALAEGLKSLGIVYHLVRQRAIIQDAFRHFASAWLDGNSDKMDESTLHDLVFFRALSDLYGPSWHDISFQINQRLKSVPSDKVNEFALLASDILLRSQTLLSILLPAPTFPKFDTPLLQFGIPVGGQNYTPLPDFAKPSPRFGMLLVGKTET